MKTIDIGKEFNDWLRNRNHLQGDGSFNAVDFRKEFLADYDCESAWEGKPDPVILDFSNVTQLGPSWANEAFAYFTKYTKEKEKILDTFKFANISRVKLRTILKEITTGYRK